MATIKDVARRAGVAPASVTRALNGHPNVSEALRQRVLRAVEETGYRPDLLAAGLRRGSSRSIGIVVGDIINPMLAEIVDSLEVELRSAGYSVLLANSHGDPARDVESVQLLHQRRVDALAVMCVDESNVEFQRTLQNIPIPVVLLDREVAGCDAASAVLSDHYRSTYRLTDHLLDAGHERMLFLTGVRGTTYAGRERLRGFTAACNARGIEIDPEMVRDARPVARTGRQIIAELLNRDALPSAIVVGPNPYLPGVLTELHARGVQVGSDVALACLDDIPLAALHQPPLTALSRSMEDMARVAASLLLNQLSGASTLPRTVVLPMELRLRPSTAAPAKSAAAPAESAHLDGHASREVPAAPLRR